MEWGGEGRRPALDAAAIPAEPCAPISTAISAVISAISTAISTEGRAVTPRYLPYRQALLASEKAKTEKRTEDMKRARKEADAARQKKKEEDATKWRYQQYQLQAAIV